MELLKKNEQAVADIESTVPLNEELELIHKTPQSNKIQEIED